MPTNREREVKNLLAIDTVSEKRAWEQKLHRAAVENGASTTEEVLRILGREPDQEFAGLEVALNRAR